MAVGLYFHVPFCKRKCPYCDFYSLSLSPEIEEKYIDAVLRNIGQFAGESIDTIYFGGGTPSLLSSESFSRIFSAINKNLTLISPEITLEANPCSVDFEKLKFLKEVGFNRISFGVQSLIAPELEMLGRIHTAEQAKSAIIDAKKAGFKNISADVMLGIIGQTENSISDTIEFLAKLPISHISAYILKIEKNTRYDNEKIIAMIPDEEETVNFYLHAAELLEESGFFQYEISNFAKSGFESRHNLKYWHCEEYIGIGPSAHSFFEGKRYYCPPSLEEFISADLQTKVVTEENPRTFDEFAMLALRLCEGLKFADLEEFEIDLKPLIKKAEPLKKAGLLNISDKEIVLTKQGFLLSNSIISSLLFE